jgi:hypothetical protein
MLSICIFGSQARQTADFMSDRDVLFVGAPSPDLERAVSHWTKNSWNVSVFDRPAFERLAEVKALFVQHLKQEGRLLQDADGFVASTFERYSPKTDYSAERNDALEQIMLLPCATDTYWQQLCLSDIVYVLFRNASILHLACTREYRFQYHVLVDQMASIFSLNQRQRASLLALRDLKHAYRNRILGLIAMPHLLDARRIAAQIIKQLPDMSASSIADGATSDNYFKLRLSELELMGRYQPDYLDQLGPESDMFDLWKRIRSSGGYPKPKVNLH